MSHPEPRISKELAPEVFALAARLYAEQDEAYSLSDLIEAGAVANIPSEFICRAAAQVQEQQNQAFRRSETLKSAVILSGIAVMLLGLMALKGPVPFGCHTMMSRADSQTTPFK